MFARKKNNGPSAATLVHTQSRLSPSRARVYVQAEE